MAMKSGDDGYGWNAVASQLAGSLHPTRLAIIEAILWIGEPVSPAQLSKSFFDRPSLTDVAYHARALRECGLLTLVDQRPVRGSVEHFYFFSFPIEAREGEEQGADTPAVADSQVAITLTPEERDALYDRVFIRLTAIDHIYLAMEGGDFERADDLAREFADLLWLIVEGLGWGGTSSEPIELRTPPDVLQRALTRLRDRAEIEDALENRSQEKTRTELRRFQAQNSLVKRTCGRVLASLEGETSSARHPDG